MRRLYWKIHDVIQRHHFKKYEKLPLHLYYDRRYKVWVHPKDYLSFSSNIIDVIDSIEPMGLYFPFIQVDENGEKYENHVHNFENLIGYAYNDDCQIIIPKEYETYYSFQELELIRRLNEYGAYDHNISYKHVGDE